MKLNKKLWSFIVGCFFAGSYVWLVSYTKTFPVPSFITIDSHTSFMLYRYFIIAILALILTACALLIMHNIMNIHANEHTFWLLLPILSFLIITAIFANILVYTMLSAAVPSLLLILARARKRKKRRIFDMEKALS